MTSPSLRNGHGLAAHEAPLHRTCCTCCAADTRAQSVLLNSIPDPAWVKDLQGRWTAVNEALARASGLPREALIGKSDFDLFPHEMAEAIARNDREALIRGERIRVVETVRYPDGTTVSYEVYKQPYRDPSGTVIGTLGIARDITERLKTEEALRESEQRFRQLVENSASVFWMVDVTSRQLLYLSPNVGALWGAPSESIGEDPRWFIERVHPEDRGLFLSLYESSADAEYEVQYRLLWPDGSVRWVRNRTFPVRNEKGEVYRIAGLAEDITEKRTMEAALLRSEHHLRQVLDSLPAFVGVMTPEGILTEANHAALSGVGLAREAAVGQQFTKLPVWTDAASHGRLEAAIERGRRGEPSRFDVTVPLAKGGTAIMELNLSPMLDESGRVTHLIPSGIDVTERARAEETTREAHLALTTLVESSPVAILKLDRQGLVTGWNRVAERVFGWTAAEVLGRPNPTIPLGDEAGYRERLRGVLEDGTCTTGLVCQRQRKGGALVDVHLSVAPVRDTSGAVREAVAFLVDMSDYRKLEEALRQAQKMEAVGQLAGGVAHDFNNLLAVILCHSGFLEDALPEGDALREDVQEVKDAAQRAATLTRQLLAFSRRQVMQPRVLRLGDVVGDMSKMLRRLIGEDVSLDIHAAEGLWNVRADPGQLEQVLMNLAVNARDAMPQGGRLTLSTRNVVLDGAFVARHTGSRPGPHVVLEVADTGCGMDEATRLRAFEPFFTTKAQGKGTGLGLAMVYGIIKQSEGYIDIESAPGQGTTVRVYLPRCEEGADVAPLSAHPGARPRASCGRILLVEDDDAVRAVAARALRQQGYFVQDVRGGAEALAVFTSGGEGFDLLLTDLVMPEMSGTELVQRMRAAGFKAAVLLMSGYTDDKLLLHGGVPADTRFIEKPFSLPSLTGRVREVLLQHSG